MKRDFLQSRFFHYYRLIIPIYYFLLATAIIYIMSNATLNYLQFEATIPLIVNTYMLSVVLYIPFKKIIKNRRLIGIAVAPLIPLVTTILPEHFLTIYRLMFTSQQVFQGNLLITALLLNSLLLIIDLVTFISIYALFKEIYEKSDLK